MKSSSFKSFLLFILFIVVVGGGVLCYRNYCAPEIFYEFRNNNGLSFNYLDEVDNYADKLHYTQLTEDEAQYYRAMYHAASNGETEYYVNFSINSDDEFRARLAFDGDFPEYFWFGDDVVYQRASSKDKFNLLDWGYNAVHQDCYDLKDEDLASIRQEIDDKVEEILPTLKGDSDYDTVLNVYKYVIDNTEYDMEYKPIQDIRASMLLGRGVCSTYAETFQLLCNKLGYECYTVVGPTIYNEYDNIENSDADEEIQYSASEDELHEWDIIKIGDEWYWVDPTWGDDLLESKECKYSDPYKMCYFLSTDEIMFLDHKYDDGFEYPACEDLQYYLTNGKGAIIHDYNQDEINSVLINLFRRYKNNYVFQFFNKEDAERLYNWLNETSFFTLYENNVYPYYSGNSSYSASNNYSIRLCWRITNYY